MPDSEEHKSDASDAERDPEMREKTFVLTYHWGADSGGNSRGSKPPRSEMPLGLGNMCKNKVRVSVTRQCLKGKSLSKHVASFERLTTNKTLRHKTHRIVKFCSGNRPISGDAICNGRPTVHDRGPSPCLDLVTDVNQYNVVDYPDITYGIMTNSILQKE